MKSNRITRKAAAVFAAVALAAAPVMAADSGELTISGTVDAINEIAVAAEGGHSSLDVVGGVNQQLVAVVTETSNNTDGYTVTLGSANEGTMKGLNVSTTPIEYGIYYGGVLVSLLNGSAEVTDAGGLTGESGVTKDLEVTIPGGWKQADTYSDTLTLTIAAK